MSGRFNLQDYVTVDERIDQFWARYPDSGSIQTEVCWVGDDGSSVAIRASVLINDRLVATGIAQELAGGGGANKTSWWENAETSAIGRALANMGMSLSKQRPSREEMQKVERDQTPRQTRPAAPYAPELREPTPAPSPRKVADWDSDELRNYANNEDAPMAKRKAAFGHLLARFTREFDVLGECARMKALHPEDVAELRDKALAALRERQPASVAG